jgi:hypothetical protein
MKTPTSMEAGMVDNVSEGPWRDSLRVRESAARATKILYWQRYDESRLENARARIARLMGGVHNPSYARSIAWDWTDPMDLEGIQVAAEEVGEEEVMRAIISQADPESYERTGKHLGMNGWIIPAGGVVLQDLLITQRITRSPHLQRNSKNPYRIVRVYESESAVS